MKFVFFGTPDIAVASLDALAARDLIPCVIVTAPDKPQGRGLQLTPSPVRTWADARKIPVLTPSKAADPVFLESIKACAPDAGVVVAYGKILPQALLDLFPKGIINMHPSLLPQHRGPAPIESQIVHEKNGEDVGVSVMLLDSEMDHGPILDQQAAVPEIVNAWPMRASLLYPILSRVGGELLAEVLPAWVTGAIVPQDQDHERATYCSKTKKEDALLELADDPEINYRKFLAYDMWPRAYFMHDHAGKHMRVVVTDAAIENDAFIIKRVIPEGRKEMSYESFLQGAR